MFILPFSLPFVFLLLNRYFSFHFSQLIFFIFTVYFPLYHWTSIWVHYLSTYLRNFPREKLLLANCFVCLKGFFSYYSNSWSIFSVCVIYGTHIFLNTLRIFPTVLRFPLLLLRNYWDVRYWIALVFWK